jgi:hypothetical protein
MNRTLASLVVTLALPLTSISFVSCKKDEPPPPLPSAAPASEPPPPIALEPVVTAEPDAGTAGAKPSGRGGKPSGNLKACCNALAQNAANAPEPNATYMKQAAATCGVLAEQGKETGSAVAVLAGILRGAGMPASCK